MKIIHLMGGGDIGGAKTHIMTIVGNLSRSHQIKLVSFRESSFAKEAQAAGIDVAVIATGNVPRAVSELFHIVKDMGADIVHCHGAKANMMGALLKARMDIPVITTVHSDYKLDYMDNPVKQLVFGGINAVSLRRLDFYQPVSDAMARGLIGRGFNPQVIFRAYNGMDFTPIEESFQRVSYLKETFDVNLPSDAVVCGLAARLTAVKDIHTALQGFALATKDNHKLHFLIAGIGEDEESLRELASNLAIADRVHFCGWITDISRFFACLDINVLSSLSEGFPYTLLEAAGARCATISTDVGGIKEFIEHGINGILFQPKDEAALARAILQLATDEEQRKLYGQRGYDKALATYSTKAVCEKQIENYEKALAVYKEKKLRRSGVVICGAYGKGNSGDEAILSSIHRELKEINPAMAAHVLSRMPEETRMNHRLNAMYTFNIFSMLRRFLKAKVYINGGGSLIQDVTSSRSLYYYLFTIFLAKILGCKVMMYGCGIGPVARASNRRLAAFVINHFVDIITLRDSTSAEELARMGVTKPQIILAGDPTLILDAAPKEKLDHALAELGIDPDVAYMGFGLRRWHSFDSIAEEIAKAAEYAYQAHGLMPLFIPIEHPNDVLTAKKVTSLLHCPYQQIQQRLPIETTIGILAKMKTVLGIRLHSLMFAAGRGVPVIGLSYDVKVDGFLRYIESGTCLELANVKAADICAIIDRCVTGELDEKVAAAAETLKRREHENVVALAKLLGERKD